VRAQRAGEEALTPRQPLVALSGDAGRRVAVAPLRQIESARTLESRSRVNTPGRRKPCKLSLPVRCWHLGQDAG
jgi:hypothetical protein